VRFGQAVSLNVSVEPRTVSITGSMSDFQEAQKLLLDATSTTSEYAHVDVASDCSVCWTEATEPLNTSCEHVYCRECFPNQASSAGDGAIPVRCFGNEGKCDHVFSINELKAMLPFATFEELLQASFEMYIRTHPEDFQYCPTPDCTPVYRIRGNGEIFLCSTCLTAVCTTCNVVSHDGVTCEEYKDLSSEGLKHSRSGRRKTT
jgi:hypothetical protein